MDDHELNHTALEWLSSGHGVAAATVIGTWGSAPRRVGSRLFARSDGVFAGSVSGGCVENAVIAEAQDVIASGRSKRLSFGVSNETAWSAGLACGGQIEVYVEKASDDECRRIASCRMLGDWLVVATNLETGEKNYLSAATPTVSLLSNAARSAQMSDQSTSITLEDENWFLNVFNSPLVLYIVGAVHIALPLSSMASLTGFHVTIIDPRSAFASPERFPGLRLLTVWPDEALPDLPVDTRTAIVTLTHDPKLDDPALAAALASKAFYIGALGSKNTHAARLERLRAAGFEESALSRIHGPAGLAIGASTPAEIAVSILAQIVQTLRKSSAP